MKTKLVASIASLLVLACVAFAPVPGQANTLHGFCGTSPGTSFCTDNGTITPVSGDTLLEFGFNRDPDSNHGLTAPISFDLVALVPSNDPTQMISETGTHTSITGSHTLLLQKGGAVFNSGTLDSFLGLTRVGGPDTPIDGFLAGATKEGISGVTGYKVYLFDFGSVTFGSSTTPTFTNSGGFSGVFPRGTELYSFIDGPGAGQAQDGAALSATIIVVGTAPPVPDPGTLTLMLSGGALVGLATWRQRFRA